MSNPQKNDGFLLAYRRAMDGVSVGCLIMDSQRKIVECNTIAADLLNRDFGTLLSSCLDDYLGAHSKTQLSQAIQSLAPDSSQLVRLEFNHTPIDVRVLTNHNHVVLLFDQSLERIENETLENEFRRFVHELGNALTSGSGYAELLSDEINNLSLTQSPLLGSFLEKIKDSLSRSTQLVDDARWRLSKQRDVKKGHIVVVEDEPITAILLSQLIEKQGHKTTVFMESPAALEWLRENVDTVDILMTDQFMPDLSGIELATDVLTLNGEMPVILCTGNRQVIEQQEKGILNIKYFISKPVDEAELSRLLSQIMMDS